MSTQSMAEVQAVSQVVQRLAALDSVEAFGQVAPELLFDLIPSDAVVFNELDSVAAPLRTTVYGMSMPSWLPEIWPDYSAGHPVAVHMLTTPDRAPHSISDFWSSNQFRRTALYGEIFAPMGFEDQLSVSVEPEGHGIIGLSFNRTARSFTDHDRAIAGLLTVGLSPAYMSVVAREAMRLRAARLTDPPAERVCVATVARDFALSPRQAQVLALLAQGETYRDIARALDVTMATIRTHIERLYRRLAVGSRGEAVGLLLD